MTLNQSITHSQEQIAASERRIKALQALRKHGLEFDPAGFTRVLFMVSMESHTPYVPVEAISLPDTSGGWQWIFNGQLYSGHWNELIHEITHGERYPVSVTIFHPVDRLILDNA